MSKWKKDPLRTSVVLTVSFVVLTAAIWFFVFRKTTPKQGYTYSKLIESNDAFVRGEGFLSSGDPKNAEEEFLKALPTANTPNEEAQIKNKLADAQRINGDLIAAIRTAKEVAGNGKYGRMPRAYAVQLMRIIYAYNPSHSGEITAEIFGTEPYSGFMVTSTAESYRNLSEYASSLYPLAYSEISVAKWYAGEIFNIKLNFIKNKKIMPDSSLSESDRQKIEGYKRIIIGKIQSADNDVTRISNLPGENSLIPEILNQKAFILSLIDRAGELDKRFPPVEKSFDKALESARGKNNLGIEASARYNYAAYLAHKFRKARKNDIVDLLKVFYETTAYNETSVYTEFFMKESSLSSILRDEMRLLASIDGGFKSLLAKNGWKF